MSVIPSRSADGIESIGTGAPADEFKITPAMMDAGVDAFRLFDRATDPEYVVWAVYQDMMKVAVAMGVVEVKCPAHLPGGLSGDVRT
jgi:hypothetical protein